MTEHPTAQWTAQQVIEAFPWDEVPRYLLRDRDRIYGDHFRQRIGNMGIEEVKVAPHSPWQNPYVERLIRSIRRECLNNIIVRIGIINALFSPRHRLPQLVSASGGRPTAAGPALALRGCKGSGDIVEQTCCPLLEGSQGSAEWRQVGHEIGLLCRVRPAVRPSAGRDCGNAMSAAALLRGGYFKRDELLKRALATLEALRRDGGCDGDTCVRTCTRGPHEGCGTRAAAGRPGDTRRMQTRQPTPPFSGMRGDHRRRTRRGQAEDQAKASWRTRAGAMGGGSTASFRCWRIFRMTSPCVMAAMIRSVPC